VCGATGGTFFLLATSGNASGTIGLTMASLLGPGSGALATVELLAATGGGTIGLSDVLLVDSSEALIEAMTRDGIVNVPEPNYSTVIGLVLLIATVTLSRRHEQD
jgi:hypothetical protein